MLLNLVHCYFCPENLVIDGTFDLGWKSFVCGNPRKISTPGSRP